MVVGAGCGVAVVVAAPVFGAIGTVTLVGAAVGAGVGAVAGGAAGAVTASKDQADQNASFREGHHRGKAEATAEVERLVKKVDAMKRAHSRNGEFEKRLVALFAVGFAAAASDGPITGEERMLIESFVAGSAYQWQNEPLRLRIAELANRPPTFGDAMALVDAVADPTLDALIDDILEIAIMADGVEHPKETAFRAAWRSHRQGRQQEVA